MAPPCLRDRPSRHGRWTPGSNRARPLDRRDGSARTYGAAAAMPFRCAKLPASAAGGDPIAGSFAATVRYGLPGQGNADPFTANIRGRE